MKKSKKGQLVCQHLENISRRVLEEYQDAIKDYIAGRHGIYALYRKNRLYYVGLASNLRGRLRTHLRDRHKDTWDRFSLYFTVGSKTIPEIEAVLIRIANPPGNIAKSKFVKSQDVKRGFTQKLKKYWLEEIGVLVGKKKKSDKKDKSSRKTKIGKIELDVALKKRIALKAKYKGKVHKASLLKTGRIRYKGKLYDSPSGAGKAVRGRGTDGWRFWRYERAPGDWVALDNIRKRKTRRR